MLPFLFCLTVWAVASAQGDHRMAQVSMVAPHPLTAGRLITVRVQGAPEITRAAFFDLAPRIRGLQLYPVGNGVWEGSLAVLPSMVGQHFQARAYLFDARRHPIPVRDGELGVRVASSAEAQPGVIAETSDGRVAVAFDATIQLDTIEVRTADQEGTVSPVLRNNYVVLPSTIHAVDVVSVTALNLQNQPVVIYGPASTTALLSEAR